MPGRHNASSISGGIFGENAIEIPKINVSTVGQHNTSSVNGGIFGDAPTQELTPRTSQMTASSLAGGLFFDAVPASRPGTARANKLKLDPAAQPVAGTVITPDNKDGLFTHDAALQPLVSARANPNQASVAGGIFAKGAPTPQKSARGGIINRNASSVPGGIFG